MSLLATVLRNGVVEAEHHGAVAVVDTEGSVVVASGDVHRRFYGRSALKPFQALVSQLAGADLTGSALAVACASHGGLPIHVAYVNQMLEQVGLTADALGTPPGWPYGKGEDRRRAEAGQRGPRPIWHNCSGKHAAMLRACVASGWPVGGYLEPDHPLQLRVAALLAEVTQEEPGSPGVDGCGAPVFASSTLGLARAYAKLASEPRFAEIWWAMHRYPALVAENPRVDQEIATWTDSAAKVGAEGAIGVAVRNRLGVAVKCWDGSVRGQRAGAVGIMEQIGVLRGFHNVPAGDPVLGGGRPQGHVQPMVPYE